MHYSEQKLFTWAGMAGSSLIGLGMVIAGFIPPPSPSLTAEQVAQLYQESATPIRIGMIAGMFGICGLIALIGTISIQLRRIDHVSPLQAQLQLVSGALGTLTLLFPYMLFLIAAYRPDREPSQILLINDVGWLLTIPGFPTFIVQWLCIAYAVLHDRGIRPVYPRWVGYFNLWVAAITLSAPLAFFVHTGPFVWSGLFPFWLAGGMFFVWLGTMGWLTLKAIDQERPQAPSESRSEG